MRVIIHMIEAEHSELYPYGVSLCHMKGRVANRFGDLYQYMIPESQFRAGGLFTATKDKEKVTCKHCLRSMRKRRWL